jgi:hypothetical protein
MGVVTLRAALAARRIKIRAFFKDMHKNGLNRNVKKCSFAKSHMKFLGHVVDSCRHRPDEEKLSIVADLSRPATKREVQQALYD